MHVRCAVSLVMLVSLAAHAAPSSAPAGPTSLPEVYRGLFSKGTRWTFAGKHTEKWWNDERRRNDVTRKALRFTCAVVEVVERPKAGGHASRIECTGAQRPTCAPLGYPLARVFLATSRGLFTAEKLPLDDAAFRAATKGVPILAARPRAEKQIERTEDVVVRSWTRRRALSIRGKPLPVWCIRDESEEADPRKQELCLSEKLGPVYVYYWHGGGSIDIHEAHQTAPAKP